MVLTSTTALNGNPPILSSELDEEPPSDAEKSDRNKRETSVTFVRVEQKTYTTRSNTPVKSRRRAMAIFEVNEGGESPSVFNLITLLLLVLRCFLLRVADTT